MSSQYQLIKVLKIFLLTKQTKKVKLYRDLFTRAKFKNTKKKVPGKYRLHTIPDYKTCFTKECSRINVIKMQDQNIAHANKISILYTVVIN